MHWYIFQTAWGWAAIAYQNEILLREVILPMASRSELLERIKGGTRILPIKTDCPARVLSERIQAYFTGSVIQNWDVRLDLSGLTPFTQQVLQKTREIGVGQTCYYCDLAQTLGNPRASRAVGQALARNPLPLIVPCHRVIGVKGLGGFSAPGGIQTKQNLLDWEKTQVTKQTAIWDVFYQPGSKKKP